MHIFPFVHSNPIVSLLNRCTRLRGLSYKTKRLFSPTKRSMQGRHFESYLWAEREYTSAIFEAKRNFCATTLPTILCSVPRRFCIISNPNCSFNLNVSDSSEEEKVGGSCMSLLNHTFVQPFYCTNASASLILTECTHFPMNPIISFLPILSIINSIKLSH